ncbi:putative nuclease HARBI1 [Penaeus vannamei]|uniref:putative nuclease HARBI1 n=1 Tax=Penaeus vannamei TaxID=6689 RepID=UPI00387F6344
MGLHERVHPADNNAVAEMAETLADIEEINQLEEIHNIAVIQPPRVVLTERNNLFLSLSDEEFVARFRISKDSVKFILNDSFDLCMKLEQGQYTGHMLGDSAYHLRSYLMTPISNPATDSEVRYSAAHAKTRNVIERAFGVWKERSRALSPQLRTKLNTSLLAICSAAVLPNIAIKHRDIVPSNDGETRFHNEYEVEGEGAANTSRAESLRKRAAIVSSVYS